MTKYLILISNFLIIPSVVLAQPKLKLETQTLNFGKDKSSLEFTISNAGDTTLSWSASEEVSWISSINPKGSNIDSAKSEKVVVKIDRTELECGVNTDSIKINSNGGNATITVTAQKVNRPPYVKNGIDSQELIIKSDDSVFRDFRKDLNMVFSDPDNGDQLSFTATSGNSNVAEAVAGGNNLKVTPKKAGTTKITLTATDVCKAETTLVFDVSVTANQPPVRLGIPDTTLTVGPGSYNVHLDNVFSDNTIFTDNDRLIFKNPESSVPEVKVRIESDRFLKVTIPKSDKLDPAVGLPETSTITVTADDGCETAKSTFSIIINDPPYVANPLPDLTIKLGKDRNFKVMIDLKKAPLVFQDPDPPLLDIIVKYEAAASDTVVSINKIEAGSSILTFTTKDTGTAQITVRAYDKRGGVISDTFLVKIIANEPSIFGQISVNPNIPDVKIDSIAVKIVDADSVKEARLFVRKGGDLTFDALPAPMTIHNKNGQRDTVTANGTIPDMYITDRGVEFYIQVTDDDDFITNSEVNSISVYVIDGVTKTNAQPEESYRLISMPLDLDNSSPESVLVDDLGEYNDGKNWRFFEPLPDVNSRPEDYPEFPKTSEMKPGKAFWLIVKDNNKIIDTNAGTTIPTDTPFPIELQTGWNYIGNPFNFPTFAPDTSSNGNTLRIYFFSEAWSDPLKPSEIALQPFEGYIIYSNINDSMLINPHRPTNATNLSKNQALNEFNNRLWHIRILAQCQEVWDSNNIASVTANSRTDWDFLDSPEPPMIGEYVSVYFPHPEWQKSVSKFTTDFRPPSADGHIWEFEVQTNRRDEVQLTFEGLASVPLEFDIWLVDDAVQISRNLRDHNQYAIAGGGTENPTLLKIVVGKSDFVKEILNKTLAIPTTFELAQNFPNPFNPSTTIRYGLPQNERVTIKIYNILGEEVATLVDDKLLEAGHHVAIWDGRDNEKQQVASGIYIYQIRSKDFSLIRKMVLVK